MCGDGDRIGDRMGLYSKLSKTDIQRIIDIGWDERREKIKKRRAANNALVRAIRAKYLKPKP